ncbi:MAG: LPS export ABC transporter periplasmic protein LptC [Candidatus Omnitrophota bacterium]
MKKVIIIILIVIAMFALVKSRKPAATPVNKIVEPVPAQQENMTQNVQAFSVSGSSEDGNNKWEVKGESADIFSDVVNIRSIEAKSEGKETCLQLTADEGVFHKESKNVELSKNVVANTDEGTTFKTDTLKWLAKDEKITTDDRVDIQRENMHLSGTGVESIPSMKKVNLKQDVKMVVDGFTGMVFQDGKKPSGEKSFPTVITCDGPLEVDYENNVSYFNKNVVIEDSQGKISADVVIAYFNPEQKGIYKVVAKGNVKITSGENTSQSDEAVYLVNEGRAILTGRPKLCIFSTGKLLEDKKAQESL